MLSAISEGYKKGIATIIDANVITLLTAFILFVLASAGVKGFAFTLGIGTIVSLFTAVLFTQAVLGVLSRTKMLSSPSFLGASGEGPGWTFDFTRLSRYFFAASGLILTIGAISFATKQLNLGIDFESGTQIQVALEEAATVDDIRSTLSDAGIEGVDTAKIQETENPDFGENVYQIQGKISPEQTTEVGPALDEAFGVAQGTEGDEAINTNAIGPTFGEQIARNALIAIIFSLLVISAYVALRFEAKYAVPVLIALVHDILITGGIYSLVGAEVSSATVAAFLTILGYSMYDTIIVFDRIRENVPRMPRAAFSQIVNRSMSEVLTRSLITGLSTVFLIGDAALLRRRDAAGLRPGDADRGRVGYLLVDLHRRPGADRVEGARTRLPLAPPPDPRGHGLRADLPRGQRGREDRRGRAPRRSGGRRRRRRGPGGGRGSGTLASRGAGRGRGAGRALGAARAEPRGGGRGRPGRPRRTHREPSSRRSGSPAAARSSRGDAESTGGDRDLMAALVWFTTGVALWHFTVFIPDRFWGGIVGALLGAATGAMITGALAQIALGQSIGDTGIETVLFAIPGTALGLALIYMIGVRSEPEVAEA